MAGIYIHIPFCRQACHYCNFHFSVSQKQRPDFLKALKTEISIQKDFFNTPGEKSPLIETLYFGGGTPSLLSVEEISSIMNTLNKYYNFTRNCETTIECNPDDLEKNKLANYKSMGINRLSIGIQSFHEEDLRYMNRSHSGKQASEVIKLSQNQGFENITADLIYGTPTMSDQQWIKNIELLTSFDIPHISAYSLTVEPKTALEVFIRKKKALPVSDESHARHFDILCDKLEKKGFTHYEISNWGKPGFFSRHNLSYWQSVPYLGLGPSAHSFLPGKRQWNVANTCTYIAELQKGSIPLQNEILSITNQINEYIMTSLRTIWGIQKNDFRKKFGEDALLTLREKIRKYLRNQSVDENDTAWWIKREARFFADGIAADLFFDE